MKKFLNKLIILEFVLFCGSLALNLAPGKSVLTMLIFVFTALLVYVYNKPPKYAFRKNKPLLAFISTSLFFTNVVIYQSYFGEWIVYWGYAIGTCIAVSTLSFTYFRDTYIKYFNYLLLISIVIYCIEDIISLPFITISTPGGNVDVYFGLFLRSLRYTTKRLSSICWEPGQLQAVIMFSICLFADLITKLSVKDLLKKIGLPILALLLTKSTTGYIALSILLIYYVFSYFENHKFGIKTFFIGITTCIAIVFGILSIFNSRVVTDKFEQSEAKTDNSFNVRRMDNLAMFQMTFERPLFGYGISSDERVQRNRVLGSVSNSNGWFNLSASQGIVYLVVILISFFKRVHERVGNRIVSITIFVLLFISQCGEPRLCYPYFYMYCFVFNSYFFEYGKNCSNKFS